MNITMKAEPPCIYFILYLLTVRQHTPLVFQPLLSITSKCYDSIWRRNVRICKFPPFSFFAQNCSLKDNGNDFQDFIVTTPTWPKQAWYTGFLCLSCEQPLFLSLRMDFLSQFKGMLVYQKPQNYMYLLAWLLSGIFSKDIGKSSLVGHGFIRWKLPVLHNSFPGIFLFEVNNLSTNIWKVGLQIYNPQNYSLSCWSDSGGFIYLLVVKLIIRDQDKDLWYHSQIKGYIYKLSVCQLFVTGRWFSPCIPVFLHP